MVSHLKTFTNKGCKIAEQNFCRDLKVINQGLGAYTTRIRRLLKGFFSYQCYYPHSLRDALSPVCGIFYTLFFGTLVFPCQKVCSSMLETQFFIINVSNNLLMLIVDVSVIFSWSYSYNMNTWTLKLHFPMHYHSPNRD